eukprot:TRINITY_DN13036_c0_g2_i1.p1 TRINITY_DN13036_c0_g2~~TRINITY_DN13036_c0_g2_i1.p1  ORF type:complete len:495 (+),score=58.25 TRINITY_DN13036_c0_g2_i1:70-1485(+)
MAPIIPGFTIVEPLGEGHAGRAFLAITSSSTLGADSSGQKVLKFFEGRKAMRNFETELRMLRAVQGHPNIVALVSDVMLDSPEAPAAVAVDYYAGGSLMHRLQESGPASELEAKEAIADTLRALLHVHALDIIHRYVKLENIVSSLDGRYVLIDFDLACYKSDEVAMSRAAGTIGFMAPEVIMSPIMRRPYDTFADMFSVGALLFFFFRLKHPFTTKVMTKPSLLRQTIHGRYRFGVHFDRVSAPCKDFFSSLLQPKADDRPSAALALEDSWLTTVADPADALDGVNAGLSNSTPPIEALACELQPQAEGISSAALVLKDFGFMTAAHTVDAGLNHPIHPPKALFSDKRSRLAMLQRSASATDAKSEDAPLAPQPPQTPQPARCLAARCFRKFCPPKQKTRTMISSPTPSDICQADDEGAFHSLVPRNIGPCELAPSAQPTRTSLFTSMVKRAGLRRPMQKSRPMDCAKRF